MSDSNTRSEVSALMNIWQYFTGYFYPREPGQHERCLTPHCVEQPKEFKIVGTYPLQRMLFTVCSLRAVQIWNPMQLW